MPLTRITSQLISIPSNYPLTGSLNGTASYATTASFAIGTGGINGAQLAKDWVNFNGTGTVAIRDSYNVSSITDNGTGYYTVNFSTILSNTNYCAIAQRRNVTVNTNYGAYTLTYNTNNYQIYTTENGVAADSAAITSLVFSN
jgi:hypothetical protein